MKTARLVVVILALLTPARALAQNNIVSSGPCPGLGSGVIFGPGSICWRTDTKTGQIWDGQQWLSLVTQSTTGDQTLLSPGSLTAATLPPAPPPGSMVNCSDCAIGPTCVSGSGQGALAKFLGGVWVCN